MKKVKSGYLFKEVEKFNFVNSEGEKRIYTVISLKYIVVGVVGLPYIVSETKTFESKTGNSETCIRRIVHNKNIKYEELKVEQQSAIFIAKFGESYEE